MHQGVNEPNSQVDESMDRWSHEWIYPLFRFLYIYWFDSLVHCFIASGRIDTCIHSLLDSLTLWLIHGFHFPFINEAKQSIIDSLDQWKSLRNHECVQSLCHWCNAALIASLDGCFIASFVTGSNECIRRSFKQSRKSINQWVKWFMNVIKWLFD